MMGAGRCSGSIETYSCSSWGITVRHQPNAALTNMIKPIKLTAQNVTRPANSKVTPKAKIIGQKKIARQDLGGLAMATALDELYGLGYAYSDSEDALYEAVTLEQTREVARKYLKEQGVVIARVSPE